MITTRSFLLPLVLLFFGSALAQREPKGGNSDKIAEIVIDLSDDKGIDQRQIAKYNGLKKGQFFRLKIDNVNTYVYDVNVGNEAIDTSADLPTSLLDLVDFGGIKSSLGNLNSVSEVVKRFFVIDSDSVVPTLDVSRLQPAEVLKEYFDRLKSDAKMAFGTIDARNAEVDEIFSKAKSFQNKMTIVNRNVSGTAPSPKDVKAALSSFDDIKTAIIEFRTEMAEKNMRFLTIMDANKETIAKNKDLKTSGSEIKKVYESLIKATDSLISQLSAANYGKFSTLLIGILNNLDFSYTSLPIQRYSDVNELVINLKPRDKNAKLSGYSTILRIPDIEKSFWGVSTGFYVTRNPENNYYVVERVETGQSFYDFLEEDTASVELGITTMIRYGRCIGKVLDTPTFWHFGFGAGLSIEQKFKPRLMAGTGLAFGNKNKIFFDIGAVHMYYDTLSKAYAIEGNTVLPENFLVNATKVNGYISLGYLIGL